MSYYSCGDCHFVFVRAGEIDGCPDCASNNVSEASQIEIEALVKYQKELESESR